MKEIERDIPPVRFVGSGSDFRVLGRFEVLKLLVAKSGPDQPTKPIRTNWRQLCPRMYHRTFGSVFGIFSALNPFSRKA